MQTNMYRVEIIANQSVQEDIAEAIDACELEMNYSFFPAVQGKGGQQKRLGDDTWPELNCLYILYVQAEALDALRRIVADIKTRFPRDGIKLFAVPAIE